jgi:hypothetical protein
MIKKALLLVPILLAAITQFAYSSAAQGKLELQVLQQQDLGGANSMPESAEKSNLADSSLNYENLPWQFSFQQQKINLPYASLLLKLQKDVLTEIANQRPKSESKLKSRLIAVNEKYEANESQLIKISNGNFLEKKFREDSLLKIKIAADTLLAAKYGTLFNDIDRLVKDISMDSKRRIWLTSIYESTTLLNVSKQINRFKRSLAQQSSTNKQAFFDANVQALKASLDSTYSSFDLDGDRRILRNMMAEAASFGPNQHISAIQKIISRQNATNESLDRFINDTFGLSRLKDQNYVLNTLLKSATRLASYNDTMLIFEKDLAVQVLQLSASDVQRKALLDRFLADYSTIRAKLADDRPITTLDVPHPSSE